MFSDFVFGGTLLGMWKHPIKRYFIFHLQIDPEDKCNEMSAILYILVVFSYSGMYSV